MFRLCLQLVAAAAAQMMAQLTATCHRLVACFNDSIFYGKRNYNQVYWRCTLPLDKPCNQTFLRSHRKRPLQRFVRTHVLYYSLSFTHNP